jgi:hypothetical protein
MARKRQSSAAVRPVMLVFFAALLALGLHGKLSGFKAPNQSRPKSVVMLIQKDETRRLAVSAPIAPRSPFLDSADIAPAYSRPRLIGGKIRLVSKPAPYSAPSHTYALRFRPPPSTI